MTTPQKSNDELSWQVLFDLNQIKDKQIEELEKTLMKLRVEGGMEEELAKCFKLVTDRDTKISALESHAERLAGALRDARAVVNELYQKSPGDYARIMGVLNEALSEYEKFKEEK